MKTTTTPKQTSTSPAPLRLLWRYPDDVLEEFPIPLDFRDEASGKTWANLSTDRFNGVYVLVGQGSLEERFQHEFLVGAVQRRFETERLRKHLWKDVEIDVPGAMDLPSLYLEPGGGEVTRVPLEKITPTQNKVYKWGVHEKAQHYERVRAGKPSFPWAAAYGIQFLDDERVFLLDGHHRFMAAAQYNEEYLSVCVKAVAMTFDEMMARSDDDPTDYISIASVLEEAMAILAEGKVTA